ncbi:hypothetical protein CRI84_06355 [Liquorilactobacillus hordei]|nr:hypothetical protein [Liquorilactobacillus hordei]
MTDLLEQCKDANLSKQLFWLVDSSGKKVHPLAIRNEPWQFEPVVSSDVKPTGQDEADKNE